MILFNKNIGMPIIEYGRITVISISEKCHSYDEEVKKAKSILSSKGVILYLPTILLAILAIALAIVCHNAALLAILFVPFFYVVIIITVLNNKFTKLCRTIADKYYQYYAISDNNKKLLDQIAVKGYSYRKYNVAFPSLCAIDNDNKGYSVVIMQKNSLYAFVKNDAINFISVVPMSINKYEYLKTSTDELTAVLKYDFGMLSIPISEIDHYRESTMVCRYGSSDLCKITFSDAKALDFLIPLKDYYYQSKKKADLQ